MTEPRSIKPGTDLGSLDDDQLRTVIRTHGLDSPWYGDEDERTPLAEVHRRDQRIGAFSTAVKIASKADLGAAVKTNPAAAMTLAFSASPATEALRAVYDDLVQRWVDGTP